MARSLRIAQMTLRLTGLVLIILGALIWGGQGNLAQAHAALGLVFVLALWCLAALGFRARAGMALALRAVVWGFVVLLLGMLQTRMWPGPQHVYIRVLHLVVGLVAMVIGEMLGASIKRSHAGTRG